MQIRLNLSDPVFQIIDITNSEDGYLIDVNPRTAKWWARIEREYNLVQEEMRQAVKYQRGRES